MNKQKIVKGLLDKFGKIENFISMEYPYEYRNKIQYSFGYGKDRKVIAGMYAKNTQVYNVYFHKVDAGEFMLDLASKVEKI